MAPSILVVDRNEAFATMLKQMLETDGGYEVRVAQRGSDALALLHEENFALTIIDMDLDPDDLDYEGLIPRVRGVQPSMRLMLIPLMGESLPPEVAQSDIQVNDASHPLARGFEAGEVIEFVMPPSGSEYEMAVLDEWTEEDGDIVFVRGPNSEASDVPSVVVIVDEFSDFRLVYVCFPVYLLPQDAKVQFVENAASWLLAP